MKTTPSGPASRFQSPSARERCGSAFLAALLAPAILTAAFASPARGAVDGGCAEQVVAQIQKRYEGVRDLEARFEQRTRSVSLGASGALGDGASSGRVVFAKPGRMRWSYEKPRTSLIVTDGETLWIHDVDAREVQRLPAAGGYLKGAALQFLLGEGKLLEQFSVRGVECRLEAESPAGVVEIDLEPREAASYERLGLRARAGTGEILETSVVDLFGNITRIAFFDVQENQDPDPAVFVLEPPPGVEVIDLTVPSP